ncbi:hypothetical protein JQC91_16320 [Jannaschia sp. Os4]|uniref:hypothetical protein n=1 Tax=Jannaschia sp. Os4 TaxID=2807617 RepID=UPI001939B50F|nr:hypothetical protein [Jannaschia sp. Os4]MBM2577874.1 hypothetical protein [Jannaschia sp. Os4]
MSEGADKPGRARPRDPSAEKARDLGRQRKIASNGSDKAARRNAPRIKAMGHRTVRRADKLAVGTDYEGSADDRTATDRRRVTHWGSDLAADRRAAQAERQRAYREAGGRKAVQAAARAAFWDRLEPAALAANVARSLLDAGWDEATDAELAAEVEAVIARLRP